MEIEFGRRRLGLREERASWQLRTQASMHSLSGDSSIRRDRMTPRGCTLGRCFGGQTGPSLERFGEKEQPIELRI